MSFSNPNKVTVKGQRADAEQLRVLGRALELADRWKAPHKAKKALVQALIVESEARNMKSTSADGFGSFGVLQGREKYHKRADLMDPAYQVGVFLGHGRGGKKTGRKGFTGAGNAIGLSASGKTSGEIAQAIEGSAYPDRYAQHGKEAERIIKLFRGGGGGGGGPVRIGARAASVPSGTGLTPDRAAILESYLTRRHGPNSLLIKSGAIQARVQQPDVAPIAKAKRSQAPTAGGAGGGGKGVLAGRDAGQLKELFYDPQGGWKNGQSIGAIGGHGGHVHVAAGPNQIVALGKLAQKLGLRAGENSHFNGGKRVTSGHAPNSNHYKDQAVDVSGDAAKMAEFARRVRQIYRVKK